MYEALGELFHTYLFLLSVFLSAGLVLDETGETVDLFGKVLLDWKMGLFCWFVWFLVVSVRGSRGEPQRDSFKAKHDTITTQRYHSIPFMSSQFLIISSENHVSLLYAATFTST